MRKYVLPESLRLLLTASYKQAEEITKQIRGDDSIAAKDVELFFKRLDTGVFQAWIDYADERREFCEPVMSLLGVLWNRCPEGVSSSLHQTSTFKKILPIARHVFDDENPRIFDECSDTTVEDIAIAAKCLSEMDSVNLAATLLQLDGPALKSKDRRLRLITAFDIVWYQYTPLLEIWKCAAQQLIYADGGDSRITEFDVIESLRSIRDMLRSEQ